MLVKTIYTLDLSEKTFSFNKNNFTCGKIQYLKNFREFLVTSYTPF